MKNVLSVSKDHKTILVFDKLPAIHKEYGFSVYRNVLVVWDEDYDTRVFTFIDSLSELELVQLAAVQEHEGSIELFWKNTIPDRLTINSNSVEVEGDPWTISTSKLLY